MRVYRPAPKVAWLGGILTCACLGYLVFGTVVFTLASQKPEGPSCAHASDIVPVLGLLAAITCIPLYILVVALTDKIVVEGLWITSIGPIRKRSIHLRDVMRVRWRKNDAVSIYSAGGRQSYWFAIYRLEDSADLIKLIRNNVPGTLQEGWHPFYQARMKGRLDRDQYFRLQRPHAKYPPVPTKPGRLLAISFSASMLVALAFWGVTLWELRNVENPPPSPLTGNWLLDCVLIGVLANVLPLSIVFIELFRSRRKRLAAIVAEAETGQSHCPEQFTAA